MNLKAAPYARLIGSIACISLFTVTNLSAADPFAGLPTECLAAWKQLRREALRVNIEAKLNVLELKGTDSSGRELTGTEEGVRRSWHFYSYKRLGEHATRLILDDQGELHARGCNKDYSFALRAHGLFWQLSSIDWSGDEVANLNVRENDLLAEHRNPALDGLSVDVLALPIAVERGLIEIESVRKVDDEPNSDVEIKVVRTNKPVGGLWLFKSGTLILSPGNRWMVRSGRVQMENTSIQAAGIQTVLNRFDESEELGGPVIVHQKRNEVWTAEVLGTLRIQTETEFKYLSAEELAPSAFRLPEFGIDEPSRGIR